MNKKLIVTQIVLWSIIALFLIAILICASTGKGVPFVRFLPDIGKMEKVHEETAAVTGVLKVALDFSSADISIETTDENELRVVQSSNGKLDPSEYVTISNEGGTLKITQELSDALFLNFIRPQQKIALYLPKGYRNELSVKCTSGNLKVMSALELSSADFGMSSGDMTSESPLNLEKAAIKTKSGNVTLGDLKCGTYDIGSVSGNVKASLMDGGGQILSTSGNIAIGEIRGGEHLVKLKSGDISIGGFSGSGSIESSSGSVGISINEIDGSLDISATSGNITADIAEELNAGMSLSCVSGDIKSNMDLSYGQDKKSARIEAAEGVPSSALSLRTVSGNIEINSQGP